MQFHGLYRIEEFLPKYCPQENSNPQMFSCGGCTYLFLLTMTRSIMLAINFSSKCKPVIAVGFQLSTGSMLFAHLLQKIKSMDIFKLFFIIQSTVILRDIE